MISEIKYNGYSATPSDYESLDGDLAVVAGLVPENGALKPIAPPRPIFTLATGQRVVALHETSSFKHYIVQDEFKNLYWCTPQNSSLQQLSSFYGAEIFQITTIGNTIVVLCSDGMHYMLWSSENQNYTYLGNKIPECPISFGLWGQSQLYSELTDNAGAAYGTFTISYDSLEDDKKAIASQILAKVNKYITEVSINKNRFIYPFFVRYAYRLYDGSLSHHSAPILMLPSTTTNPIVYAPSKTVGSNSATLDIYSIAATLDYLPLISDEQRVNLNNWSDIVKSIDIFISAPIYTYDQGGTECSYRNSVPLSNDFYGRFVPKGGGLDDTLMGSTYQQWQYYNIFHYDYNDDMGIGFDIPEFSTSDINSKIKDCSLFYFLTSIDIADLPTVRADVEIEDGVLGSLVAREPMKDDYQTHDILVPSFAQVYNSRLNIANIERRLFSGYDTAAQVAYCNGYVRYNYIENTIQADPLLDGTESVILYTSIQGDKTLTVQNTCSTPLNGLYWNYPYLFYPDINAKKVTIYKDAYNHKTLAMEPHTSLNGAVRFSGLYNPNVWDTTYLAPIADENPIISLPNKIYTSEVNNPFFFPLLNIDTVGTGEIIGISTAAKALSEGQFGQFPLYAFTTDGVWALEVSATGSYSAKQPITRDICLGRESITQIDSAVLFATDRGIMLLSGSESICISDVLESKLPFNISQLPQATRLLTNFTSLAETDVSYVSFRDFIANCRMIYDYIQQRIIVMNPNYLYAYVYSLESKAWGIMASNLQNVVPAYPEALAMNSSNQLVDLSQLDANSDIPAFFITRPIKIDRDILKTIDTIIQRGYFKKGHVKTALYGSRDMFNWSLIYTSADHYLRGFRGTPYKYFRIAAICSFDSHESISGCTIQYEMRQTNNPR